MCTQAESTTSMKHQGAIKSELDNVKGKLAEKQRSVTQLKQDLAVSQTACEERDKEIASLKDEQKELMKLKKANKQLSRQVEEGEARSTMLSKQLMKKEKVYTVQYHEYIMQ